MQLEAEQVIASLQTLHDTVVAESGAMSDALLAARQDANDITAGGQAFATDRAKLSYFAGKASGLDVWLCDGASGQQQECSSHVNAVLSRRYSGFEIRYKKALTDAKGLAYIARRAIEQRIGIRLSDITNNVGPLDPPSTWAEDECTLTGIDYQNLRQAIGPDAGTQAQQDQTKQTIAANFANGFIGDWTQKLSDFITFYNVAYPLQDGGDNAVLSLRETLLGGKPMCLAPSPNLLVDSSRLYATRSASIVSVGGWTRHSCPTTDTNCLKIQNASTGVLPPGGGGDISWLSDPPRVPPQGAVDVENQGTLAAGPDGLVSQEVLLNTPGTYLLTWWDQARDLNSGLPTTSSEPPYQVSVYDSTWRSVAGSTYVPTPATDGSVWSARNVLPITVTASDVFHIAFGASASSTPGSVAISDVQLELATSSGTPSPYTDTDRSGSVTAFQCALGPADLRAAFQRNCDPDGTCYYDLTTPIVIDTQTMTSNGTSLAGKLAAGNFNFRHIDVTMNVVGTGVIDCTSSGSPDCFGSGYLTYKLDHVANSVGILGYDGQYRTFDFGIASIDHAKALTAERYLTTPLGSADQSLVTQLAKPELRGRPIDGTYNLRIYDNPALHFGQIEDIQLVLNYHYWSRVSTSNTSN